MDHVLTAIGFDGSDQHFVPILCGRVERVPKPAERARFSEWNLCARHTYKTVEKIYMYAYVNDGHSFDRYVAVAHK